MTRLLAGIFIILAAGCLAHAPSPTADFIWDDDSYLTKNILVGRADGLAKIWLEPEASPQYYPLVFTGFWIEGRLWGLNPLGFRWMNVLMHLASALLLWQLVRQLNWRGGWIAGLLFAVHPMTVESVAWITERKNVQALLLMLLSLMALSRAAGLTAAPPRRHDGPLAFLLFLAALLSKTMASCGAVFAWLMMVHSGRFTPLAATRRLWPWFLAALALGLHTAHLEASHVGARGDAWALDFGQHCVLAARIVWHYLTTFAWPVELCFSSLRWDPATLSGQAWGLPIALVSILAFLWPHKPARTLALAVLAALFPALGFFKVYPMRFSWVADHFAHFALPALCLAAALLLHQLGRAGKSWLLVAALALACPLALSAREHGRSFVNEETLWTATLQRNPASFLALHNLGVLHMDPVRLQQAHDLMPDDPLPLANLASVALEQGEYDKARDLLIAAGSLDPGYPRVQFVQGLREEHLENWAAAERHYRQCLKRLPRHWPAWRRLANTRWRQHDAQGALALLDELLDQQPEPWQAAADPVWAKARRDREWLLERMPPVSGH